MNGIKYTSKGRKFTLVEMMVVVSILAILASLLLPGLQNALKAAQSTQCSSNFTMIGHAFTMFAEDNNGMSPTANFFTAICPYLGVEKVPPFPYACPSKSFTPRTGRVDDANIMVNSRLGKKDPVTYEWKVRLIPQKNASKLFFVFDALLRSDDPDSGLNWAPWIYLDNTTNLALRFDYDRHPYGATLLYVDGHVEPQGFPESSAIHWIP